jgi:hypothetical protein
MVYSLANYSVKLFNKPIGFVQTHRYYSKKSTRPSGPTPHSLGHNAIVTGTGQALIGLILGDYMLVDLKLIILLD